VYINALVRCEVNAMMRLLMIGVLVGSIPVASAAQTGTTAATAEAEAEANKIICRKRAEIGSLVRKKKECFTKAEWDRITESQVRGTRRMQDELMGGMRCDPAVQPC
jgi:hypothetical protein